MLDQIPRPLIEQIKQTYVIRPHNFLLFHVTKVLVEVSGRHLEYDACAVQFDPSIT